MSERLRREINSQKKIIEDKKNHLKVLEFVRDKEYAEIIAENIFLIKIINTSASSETNANNTQVIGFFIDPFAKFPTLYSHILESTSVFAMRLDNCHDHLDTAIEFFCEQSIRILSILEIIDEEYMYVGKYTYHYMSSRISINENSELTQSISKNLGYDDFIISKNGDFHFICHFLQDKHFPEHNFYIHNNYSHDKLKNNRETFVNTDFPSEFSHNPLSFFIRNHIKIKK